MKTYYTGLILVLSLLGGCSTVQEEERRPHDTAETKEAVELEPVPEAVLPSPEPDMSQKSNTELCEIYGSRSGNVAAARAELRARDVFTGVEWRNIDDRNVIQGMGECAVIAALSPDTEKVVNVTYSNGDKGRTLYYRCGKTAVPHCPYTRIDIRDGRVVSVSEADFIE